MAVVYDYKFHDSRLSTLEFMCNYESEHTSLQFWATLAEEATTPNMVDGKPVGFVLSGGGGIETLKVFLSPKGTFAEDIGEPGLTIVRCQAFFSFGTFVGYYLELKDGSDPPKAVVIRASNNMEFSGYEHKLFTFLEAQSVKLEAQSVKRSSSEVSKEQVKKPKRKLRL